MYIFALIYLLIVLLTVSEFIGHLHPLLVHLPIGILLMALLLQWLSRKEKYKALQPAVVVVFLAGAISALLSCITGYILSTVGDYDDTLVAYHMSSAIVLTVVAFLLWVKEKNPMFEVPKKLLSISLFLLIVITGHLGGSLTHGSDYLTKPLTGICLHDSASLIIKPKTNVQQTIMYNDAMNAIAFNRYYYYDKETKQKGGLRMNDSLLMKEEKTALLLPRAIQKKAN